MPSAAEKANQARVRDNQRRSRARRKEYLQELESKLRYCKLQSVNADAEIQNAARRVSEENRKLRILLIERGIVDEGVEGWFRDDGLDVVNGGIGCDGVEIVTNTTVSHPVQVPETLPSTRKACCPAAVGERKPSGCSTSSVPDSKFSSRSISLASMGTVEALWDPELFERQNEILGVSRGAGSLSISMSMPRPQVVRQQQQQQQQYLTPSSVPDPVTDGSERKSGMQQQQQGLQMVNANSNGHGYGSTNTSTAQPMFDFEAQLALLQMPSQITLLEQHHQQQAQEQAGMGGVMHQQQQFHQQYYRELYYQ